jgi:hypothetical protein
MARSNNVASSGGGVVAGGDGFGGGAAGGAGALAAIRLRSPRNGAFSGAGPLGFGASTPARDPRRDMRGM